MRIDDKEYIDDHTLNIKDYLKDMKNSKSAPKTSCPSIQDFGPLRDKDNIFVVTLASSLSGTYNSAMQAKAIIQENSKTNLFIYLTPWCRNRRNHGAFEDPNV